MSIFVFYDFMTNDLIENQVETEIFLSCMLSQLYYGFYGHKKVIDWIFILIFLCF